jgi:hypothetical protein
MVNKHVTERYEDVTVRQINLLQHKSMKCTTILHEILFGEDETDPDCSGKLSDIHSHNLVP